jgi:hypothetical protein
MICQMPQLLYLWKKNCHIHCRGGKVGPIAVWMGVEKKKNHYSPPGLKPQTIQPVASHCTNYAISALHNDDDDHYRHLLFHHRCDYCRLHYHQVPVLLKVSCVILSNDTAVSSETLQFIAAIFWYFVQN